MNDNKELNHKIMQKLLNDSATHLGQPTLTRLRYARERAMTRYLARSSELTLSWAGNVIHAAGIQFRHRMGSVILLAVILLGAGAYWNPIAKPDTADIDIAILTGELPIHFYVD